MKNLTGSEIIAVNDRKIIPVEVPEWGGTVHLRSLSLGELSGLDREFSDSKTGMINPHKGPYVEKFLALSICDAGGVPLFSVDQLGELSKKSYKVLAFLSEKATELSRTRQVDLEDLQRD